MKKNYLKKSAFTLIEMIIAITVFTIFMGFSISSYLVFHRANQEALITRSLLMDAQNIIDTLGDAIKKNKIDYAKYQSTGGAIIDGPIKTSVLYLLDENGEDTYVYGLDVNDNLLASTQIKTLEFKIFPSVDPFDPANRNKNKVQFQPIVEISLTMAARGHIREEISINLSTSVTSRYYK